MTVHNLVRSHCVRLLYVQKPSKSLSQLLLLSKLIFTEHIRYSISDMRTNTSELILEEKRWQICWNFCLYYMLVNYFILISPSIRGYTIHTAMHV